MHVGGGLISVCGSIIHSHDMEDGKDERTGVVTRKSIINRLTITLQSVSIPTKLRESPEVVLSFLVLFSSLLSPSYSSQYTSATYTSIPDHIKASRCGLSCPLWLQAWDPIVSSSTAANITCTPSSTCSSSSSSVLGVAST